MSDVSQLVVWTAVLVGGVGACLVLRRLGVATTYTRDVLHVGAGVWVLGWPGWSGWPAPVGLCALALAGTIALGRLSARSSLARRIVGTFASGDEHWSGLVEYTLSFTVMTALALRPGGSAFPAAAALLALALGDGMGGLVGRHLGRRRFAVPGGKQKSVEGSLTVAIGAAVGATWAAALYAPSVSLPIIALVGGGAAVAEAASPRGTDNLIVPAAVWALAELAT